MLIAAFSALLTIVLAFDRRSADSERPTLLCRIEKADITLLAFMRLDQLAWA
jgi:hypothetical protein